MVNPRHNKRKGSKFEIAVRNYLNERGLQALRLALEGKDDQGDVELILGPNRSDNITLECKNVKQISMTQHLREAVVESANAGTRMGVVVQKKNGTTDMNEQFVYMRMEDFLSLIEK